MMPRQRDGFYDDQGNWQRTKFCFVDCGDRCTCKPPLGIWRADSAPKNSLRERLGMGPSPEWKDKP